MDAYTSVKLDFSPESLNALYGVLAFVMFGVALDLRPAQFRLLAERPKPVLVGLASQLLLLPALTYLLILLFKPAPSLALGMLLVSACPGGNISNFISHFGRGNAALSVTLTSIVSLSAVVMTPFLFAFWVARLPASVEIPPGFQVPFWETVGLIGLMVLAPLLSGMLVAEKLPRIAKRLHKPMQILSLVVFAGFIGIAFSKNYTAFLQYWWVVMGLVVLHNAVALAAGLGWAKLLRLNRADARTVSVETGIQNSGLGLVLIFGFFDGNGGMALIAGTWGFYHTLSGLAIASLWRYQDKARLRSPRAYA